MIWPSVVIVTTRQGRRLPLSSIARFAARPCSFGKTRVCLDVFAELGLLQITQRPKLVHIRLCAGARKADLEKSAILNNLKNQKAGSNYGSESGAV